ncbi:replication factor C subunit 2/4 [Fonticula alba]|uniref:Replication factor C subunit 2/4 n=1 Tax=Fonticula alba TaxID=691883 RepID=A0A058Z0Y8_FONAL|nr:replication factor C subunit 2/4 [Fonticula alba]KCV67919.1 replication factor C subunit 2/4 [Fonticula alba]|eukprot:XP_009497739.1 replication factor C subunit 2/4 [Fonticula alba]
MTDFVSSSVALPGASSMPWVEKYRPRSINDVAQQEQVVKVLRRSLVSENLPHLLFYGPPGTGKTSTILALARDLYGPLFRQRVLELNASDERGIRVIREKVQVFASTYVSAGATVPGAEEDMDTDEPGRAARRVPPFKLIILDEADSMTADAQAALRRVIEVNARTTRFCLVCNYVSRCVGVPVLVCAFPSPPLPGL